MFRKIKKHFNYMRLKALNDQYQQEESSSETETEPKENIPASIGDVQEKLKAIFTQCSDFVMRELELTGAVPHRITIAYMEGLVNQDTISNDILKALKLYAPPIEEKVKVRRAKKHDLFNHLRKTLVVSSNLLEVEDFKKTVQDILSGFTIIYMDGQEKAISVGTQQWKERSIQEPNTETVVRGPREGFVESIGTNITLIRRKIKNSKLKFETMQLGERTNTQVAICYIKGLANEDIIETVRRRLRKIKVDAILESGYIEQFIEDAPFSLFSTIGNSERPDKVAAKILEGRIAILCDGTPIVLTVPYLFIEAIQSTEDYYTRTYFSSYIRILSLSAFMLSAFLPSIYVGILLHHLAVIPFDLLVSVTAAREGVPFSPFIEALFMIIVFEFLRESGVRMPRAVGQTVSIVGALVIGEAAVSAGFVSPIMVIVIALTGICSFIVPSERDVLPILRILFLIGAQILGYLGVLIVATLLLTHLASLRSFGVPYLSTFAPTNIKDLKDSIIRVPLWMMTNRPQALNLDHDQPNNRMSQDILKKED